MTLEEMEAAGRLAGQIKQAKEALKVAEERLALLKGVAKARKDDWAVNMSWSPEIILKPKADSWGRDIKMRVEIPFGVVQQQLVDAVCRARRELILLGGEV